MGVIVAGGVNVRSRKSRSFSSRLETEGSVERRSISGLAAGYAPAPPASRLPHGTLTQESWLAAKRQARDDMARIWERHQSRQGLAGPGRTDTLESELRAADLRLIDKLGEIAYDMERPVVTGWVFRYGLHSRPFADGHVEEIHRQALRPDLRSVYASADHDRGAFLGSVEDGHLLLRNGPRGLFYALAPHNRPECRSEVERIDNAFYTGSSGRFLILKDRWSTLPGGRKLRTILDLELVHVSPVPRGQYSPHSSIAVERLGRSRQGPR